jgi:MFS family permease
MLSAFRSWRDRDIVLALGVTQVVGYGTFYYSYAVLVPDIGRSLGVSQTVLFAIFSAGLVAGGLIAPRLGRLLDRIGAPRVMLVGSCATAALMAALAAAPGIWTFGAIVILIEALSFAVLYDAAFASLAQVARGEVRRAITALTLIAGFASTLFWPLTGWLVDLAGWRVTVLAYAVLHLILAAPLHLFILRRRGAGRAGTGPGTPPVRCAPLPDAEARRAFWLVGISLALTGMAISALGVHMIAILAWSDLGNATFAVAMVMGPAQVLIRIVDATVWRHRHPLAVAMVAAAAVGAAVAALALPAPPVVAAMLFATLLGVGGGLSSIVRGALPLALFGARGIGAQLGRLAALRNLLGALAPFAFAAVTAASGYAVALSLLAVAALCGLGALLPLIRPVRAARRVMTERHDPERPSAPAPR